MKLEVIFKFIVCLFLSESIFAHGQLLKTLDSQPRIIPVTHTSPLVLPGIYDLSLNRKNTNMKRRMTFC